jgi:hypothetical protein
VKEKEIEDELVSIRSMMERSSKFISLSGLSGILAGVYALVGAGFAYDIIYNGIGDHQHSRNGHLFYIEETTLLSIALLVLLASLVTGYILTRNKAKRRNQPIWGNSSRALIFNMSVPLVAGGLLILTHIYRGHYGIVSPSCLIFYGLALVSASNFTFKDVRYLGMCEIVLGLIAACLPGYGLLFWAIGFGVLHIIYGSMMYFKYDR